MITFNRWVYKNGIPDVTCQQYQAINMECSAINTCMNCDHDTTKGCCELFFSIKLADFYPYLSFLSSAAIAKYPKISVSEYGSVRGDDNIRAEIYARGPISAYLNAEVNNSPLFHLVFQSQITLFSRDLVH